MFFYRMPHYVGSVSRVTQGQIRKPDLQTVFQNSVIQLPPVYNRAKQNPIHKFVMMSLGAL
jgi:hypothetical protein